MRAGSSRTVLDALEMRGGEREQLRGGLQIPIGRSRVHMPEIGAQQREPRLDVLASPRVAVGVEQRVDREGVAQIMRLWADTSGSAVEARRAPRSV